MIEGEGGCRRALTSRSDGGAGSPRPSGEPVRRGLEIWLQRI